MSQYGLNNPKYSDDMKYLWAAHPLVYYSNSNSIYQYIVYITFPRAARLLRASLGKLSSMSTLHMPNTRLLRASLQFFHSAIF
jgi:hypothetical protein